MGTLSAKPVVRSETSRVTLATRIADYVVMALVVVVGAGSLVLFVWPNRPTLVAMNFPVSTALWWDALLSFVFFVQHSGMVRRTFRARLSAVIPVRYDGAFYAITSGIALTLFIVLFQPAGEPLFVLQGIPRLLVQGVAVAAVAGVFWSAFALPGFDPLALRPIWKHVRGVTPEEAIRVAEKQLLLRGPYRWVRHPIYSCVIVLLWADPEMRPTRLLVAILWSAWICAATRLEERDLITDFGDAYRRYRATVPMLIPWKRPRA